MQKKPETEPVFGLIENFADELIRNGIQKLRKEETREEKEESGEEIGGVE